MVGIVGWRNILRGRRAAINQAQIRKECKFYAAFFQGHRAFREGLLRGVNPYQGEHKEAWFNGWDYAQLKQQEKDNE